MDYPDGWDEAYVAEHFLGLSRERVQRMFEESGIEFTVPYSEDLMHMAERGFSYYLPAFIGALKSCLARADEEGREWLWKRVRHDG